MRYEPSPTKAITSPRPSPGAPPTLRRARSPSSSSRTRSRRCRCLWHSQFTFISPGRPPAAVSARSSRPARRLTAPTTCAYVGTSPAAHSPVRSATNDRNAVASSRARALQAASTRQPSSACASSARHSRASPTSGCERCFVASNRAAFRATIRVPSPNTVHEPVVKSCRRVPTARTTSASATIAVGVVASRDADRPDPARVVGRQAGLARHRLDDRQLVPLDEARSSSSASE